MGKWIPVQSADAYRVCHCRNCRKKDQTSRDNLHVYKIELEKEAIQLLPETELEVGDNGSRL
jgi:hypothetical protein